jgi:hypothetical protein
MESSRRFRLFGEIVYPLTVFEAISETNAQVADGQQSSGCTVCYRRHFFSKLRLCRQTQLIDGKCG